jgi:murein L,D-transpeptidase YcbB/YkuD
MMILPKKTLLPLLLLLSFFVLLVTTEGCKRKRSEMAIQFYKYNRNKVFKNINPDSLNAVFRQEVADEKTKLPNGDIIFNYYDQNDYDLVFVMDHLFNKDLDALPEYFDKANLHGLNPKLFHGEEIRTMLAKLRDKSAIKTATEAYQDMARLELLSASDAITYSNAMQFGLINPKKIFNRYYMQTALPDSASMSAVFQVKNLASWLDSIQPKSPQYLALQKALDTGYTAPGISKEETKRILLVNLERLRWKNKPATVKYVWVNIPDYRLDFIDSGKSVLSMKVCVGEGRNKANQNTLESYNDTCKVDKPYRKETPLLNSLIYMAQVNPIWNIPQSIVSREIIKAAMDDRYYLANKNINVYKNGRRIDNTEDINWRQVSKGNEDYEFKQQPGGDNSLGKIKFLFKNKSSVYLHDTPTKSAFRLADRDVSHGCVRLEKPLDFAHALFGDGPKYKLIEKDMAENNPEPSDLSVSPKVPVFITYMTCWKDETGVLQFRKDVYGLDIVLYDHLKRYLKA